jgi:hypothetical protein
MRATNSSIPGSHTELSQMNSFALALVLGGLRGPLVMILWSSSETQKADKDLEDFDTKVEWIRLLQPEFDTVHIFQIWNKAYNISVKMTSKANKYTTILDALEYARRVDQERPNNINILSAIAGIYADKLNASSEKQYYWQRVRSETLPHSDRSRARRNEAGWRPSRLPSMLDAQGNLLPQYLDPGNIRLGDPSDPMNYYDGSELQFLKEYQPFPYGIPAVALGYNYYKRAQLLQSLGGQRHAQLSDLVVDSRPALTMQGWAQNEMQDGRVAELAAYGKPVASGTERPTTETLAAGVKLAQPVGDVAQARQALFEYDRCARLCRDALVQYQRHVKDYPTNLSTVESHEDDLRSLEAMASADAEWLRAALALSPEEKAAHVAAARDGYRKALAVNQQIVLKYFTPPQGTQQIFPPGLTRQNVMDKLPLDPDQVGPILARMLNYVHQTGQGMEHQEDIDEYMRYMQRAATRLKGLPAK